MVATDRVTEILTDARGIFQSALFQLEAGDIRDAAEKAWCATKRATDALILARRNEEPENSTGTSKGLRELAGAESDVRRARLVGRYYARQASLHGECFYMGLCEPLEDTARYIRTTARYINDAERLATRP